MKYKDVPVCINFLQPIDVVFSLHNFYHVGIWEANLLLKVYFLYFLQIHFTFLQTYVKMNSGLLPFLILMYLFVTSQQFS